MLLPDEKVKCPYSAFKVKCFDGVTKHKCPKWIRVTGLDPQTGNPVDTYGCADTFMPMLTVENSQQQRQTAAAVESLRNVVAMVGQLPDNAPIAPKLIN